VQWSGMPDLPADKIRAALDAADLKAISAHVAVETFEKDFDAAVRFWKTVGVDHVAVGTMMKDCKANLEAWLQGAKRLAALGAKLRAEGIRFAYHNHNFEFDKFPGDPRRKIDILLESTPPENLKAEFDVAWVYAGGADPAEYLRKYRGRIPVIHVKDLQAMKKGGKVHFMPLGQGAQKWKEIFAAAHEAGVEWFAYEQDSGDGSPFDFARQSYEFLSKNWQ
jgi:sugar phosphate isomerase/epimerase